MSQYKHYPQSPYNPTGHRLNFYNFNSDQDFINALERDLPAYFSRQEAAKILGGLISAKTMSNEDALGRGVGIKLRIGNKIGYEKQSFIQWVKNRLKQF